MSTAQELFNELRDFKKETKIRFKNYPIMDDKKLELILINSLKGILKENEKLAALNRIYAVLLVSSTITILLILFLIYIFLFTVPI